MRKVRRLGGESGQFWHNRPSNAELGMKILQKEITGTQSSFSTNFKGKLSFIQCFRFPERLHCWYIYFSAAPTCTIAIITLEPSALNLNFSISYPDIIKFPYFSDAIERGG